MLDFVKKLSPTHEPIAYVVLLALAYQLIFHFQDVPQDYIQYGIQVIGGLIARQAVKPLAKINTKE